MKAMEESRLKGRRAARLESPLVRIVLCVSLLTRK